MALNMCELWSNGIKLISFVKKIKKIAQRLWTSPQTSVYNTLER